VVDVRIEPGYTPPCRQQSHDPPTDGGAWGADAGIGDNEPGAGEVRLATWCCWSEINKRRHAGGPITAVDRVSSASRRRTRLLIGLPGRQVDGLQYRRWAVPMSQDVSTPVRPSLARDGHEGSGRVDVFLAHGADKPFR
jgi:hypothetical protein